MAELVARLSPLNKPHVPELFKEIMRNHKELAEIKAAPVISFKDATALLSERVEYRRGAEKALKWNKDKGNPA